MQMAGIESNRIEWINRPRRAMVGRLLRLSCLFPNTIELDNPRITALPATLPQRHLGQGYRGPFHSTGAPGSLSAVSWPARSEQERDARGTPDLSSPYAFARSFSCESLRSWVCQEANRLCRSCSLQRPRTTFGRGRFLRLVQLSQESQLSQV